MVSTRVTRSTIAGLLLAASAVGMAVAPASAEVSELRVAKQYGLGFLPLMVMESETLFEKRAEEAGLDTSVSWLTLGGPAAVNEALLAGNVDMVSNGPPSFLIMWNRTQDTPQSVRGVSPVSQLPMWLNSTNPDIQSLEDFTEEDRIAVTAVKTSIPAIIMQMWAAEKWGAENYEHLDTLTTSLPHPDGMSALLSDTEITAHFTSPPYQYMELQNEGVHRVATSYELMGSPATFTLIYTTNAFAEENPETLNAFFLALQDAHAFINENHDRAADIYLELAAEGGVSKEQVLEILADPDVQFTATPQGLMQYAGFMHEVGTLTAMPADWTELFFDGVHDLPGN